MYLTRTLETSFKEASRQFPVLLVTGARQVGKTTFLRRVYDYQACFVALMSAGPRDFCLTGYV